MKRTDEKAEPDQGVVLAGVEAYESTPVVPVPQCPTGAGTVNLTALKNELDSSVQHIRESVLTQTANATNKLLVKESGRFENGLKLLALQEEEAKAMKTLQSGLEKEPDTIQGIRALEAFDRRFRDHYMVGRLADWLFVTLKNDKQPWDKIGTHPVTVSQDSPFADKISADRLRHLICEVRVSVGRTWQPV